MPNSITIKLDRSGPLWGWTVLRGGRVAATCVLPRLRERTARRRAEKVAARVLRDNRPLYVEYPYIPGRNDG